MNWSSLYHLILIQQSFFLFYSQTFFSFFFFLIYGKAKMNKVLADLNVEDGQVLDQNTQ